MRTSNWILTAALLVSISAAAQQATDTQPSAQPAKPDAASATQSSQPFGSGAGSVCARRCSTRTGRGAAGDSFHHRAARHDSCAHDYGPGRESFHRA